MSEAAYRETAKFSGLEPGAQSVNSSSTPVGAAIAPHSSVSTPLMDNPMPVPGRTTANSNDAPQPNPPTRSVKQPSAIVQQARAAGKAEQASLTPEEKQAARKERRERTRKAKLEQNGMKKLGKRNKGRRGRSVGAGGGRYKKRDSATLHGSPGQKDTPDPFDQWLGRRLKAWCDGVVLEEGSEPPAGCAEADEIEFDLSEDEIAFPTSLSALRRRQVHGWAMQLALFHASSGEDTERHVIVSKTGEFQGKLLTRGGRMWYKEGVEGPDVRRFALQEGHEELARPLLATLKRFSESISKRETGFIGWLTAKGTGPLDGSNLAEAREGLTDWPNLQDTEWEYVDTIDKLSSLVQDLEAGPAFGFDVEAHNARTFYGLTCLLQISTAEKDYVVDPLAEGMWEAMSLLREVFVNPDVLKIGHSIRSCDVPSLFRDFGIVLVNSIDTEEAAHALGDTYSGLAAVLETAGVEEMHDISGLKQAMQACDWRERPLTSEQLCYARCDSHYLVPLWRLMRARLLAEDTDANRRDAQDEQERKVLEKKIRDADKKAKRDAQDSFNTQNNRPSHDSNHRRSGDRDVNRNILSSAVNGHLSTNSDVSQASASGEFLLPGSSPTSSSAEFLHDDEALQVHVSGAAPTNVGDAVSPVPHPQENWPTQWESPEDCHKQQRSRSGSFLRSELESINETDAGEMPGGNSARNLLESDFADAFGEEEDGDEGRRLLEDGGKGHLAAMENLSANGVPFDLGNSLLGDSAGDGTLSDDVGEDEDEDEDLWDGWGQQEVDVGVGVDGQVVAGVDEGLAVAPATNGTGAEQESLPDFVPVVDDPVDDPSSIPSTSRGVVGGNQAAPVESELVDEQLPAEMKGVAAAIGETASTGRQESQQESQQAGDSVGVGFERGGRRSMWPHDRALQTDGVRLLWKVLSRTQLTAAVLWHPVPEAKREGAHNERHFRTAVQRLTPPRWTDVNVRVYEEIYLWRDRTARRLDDGPAYVCPGDILIDVALALPTTIDALRRVSAPLSPVLGTGNTPEATELVNVVRDALGLPKEKGEGGEVVGRGGGSSGFSKGKKRRAEFFLVIGITVVAGLMIGLARRQTA